MIKTKLEQEIEKSKEWSKRQNTFMFTQIGKHLERNFRKQLSKHKNKSEKLIKELEVIASQ